MKSLVVVSSNSDSDSSSVDLEVSLSIDQSHQMRVSDKGGAPSSRSVRPDHISDDRGLAIVEVGDRGANDRTNVTSSLMVEEDDDREIDEQGLPGEDFVDQDEEVGGNNSPFDHASPVHVRSLGSGLSRYLIPRCGDDIASSSTYNTLEKFWGDDDWSGLNITIPRPHGHPWTPLEDFMCLYDCYFSHGGMWFPLPQLVLEYCEVRRVVPSQLTCVSYCNICAILIVAVELGRSVNLAQLEEMVGITKSGECGRF